MMMVSIPATKSAITASPSVFVDDKIIDVAVRSRDIAFEADSESRNDFSGHDAI
jgi:hypothetical protein